MAYKRYATLELFFPPLDFTIRWPTKGFFLLGTVALTGSQKVFYVCYSSKFLSGGPPKVCYLEMVPRWVTGPPSQAHGLARPRAHGPIHGPSMGPTATGQPGLTGRPRSQAPCTDRHGLQRYGLIVVI